MQSKPQRLLATTATSTFESLALLLAEPAGAPPAGRGAADALGDGAVGARVAFAGTARGAPAGGALAVAVSAGVAAALAENMLGVGAAGADERRDAVGEFANVVCGHVLSEAGGPEAVFRLAAPVSGEAGAELGGGAAAGPGAWRAWLDVEGGAACVTLEAPAALFDAEGSAP